MATFQTGDDFLTEAMIIVDGTNGTGTYTTIAAALAAAVSGQTIFIKPGTYTQDLTLVAGVNLTAWPTDANATVNIVGNCTFSGTGAVIISGMNLQTNNASFLTVSGGNVSQVSLLNCFLSANNSTGITYSSSNASSMVSIYSCYGNINTTGIALFAHSSAGSLSFYNSDFTNTGGSSTANTASSGTLSSRRSAFTNPITTSSTNSVTMTYTQIDSSAQNATALTCGGSGSNNAYFCYLSSGTASSLSIGSTMDVFTTTVVSSNTNAITGSGTILYQGVTFRGSSTTINTTTQTSSGTLQGSKNTAPASGFLGEQIRQTVARASPVAMTNNTTTNVTSINLTAGVWDISTVGAAFGITTGTSFTSGASLTSATLSGSGDNYTQTPISSLTNADCNINIPAWRQTFTQTTTVYLCSVAIYTVGTGSAYGRISATRVG